MFALMKRNILTQNIYQFPKLIVKINKFIIDSHSK